MASSRRCSTGLAVLRAGGRLLCHDASLKAWSRLIAAVLLLGAVAALLASACQMTKPGAGPDSGGVLRVGLPADVVTLDPPMFTDTYSGFVSSQIHEPLFMVDFDQRIVPWLAEKLDQPDPSTYLITLRRGVRFHNGQELTADDVKFSFDRVMDPATRSPRAWRLTDAIESPEKIQVVDRYTLRLILKQPFAPFLERLTQPSSFILNAEAIEAAGGEPARQPVGTGPFKLEEWKTGERVTLTRFGDYWAGQASLQGLTFRPIPDSQTRLAELESGGLDLIINVPSEEVSRLKAEGKHQILTAEAVGVFYLGYNTRKAPLQNLALRQAMNYAVDRPRILSALYDDVGEVAYSPLNPSSWAFNPNAEHYRYDPKTAAERLQLAGGAPDQPLELVFSQVPEVTRVAERIQAQLKENLGLKVNLKPMEFGALLSYIKTGNDHQLFLLSWSGAVDPDGTLFPLFHSKNFGAAGNRAFYQNSRVDQLLSSAQTTIDQEERKRLYLEAQQLILGEAPWLPIRHGVFSAAQRSDVRGYRLHPLNNQVFTGVTVR